MANLADNQIQDRIKTPKNKQNITDAFFYEERIRMHSIPEDQNPTDNEAFNRFMRWVAQLLESEKQDRFKELLPSPLPTTDLTDDIFKTFKKIFQSSNARFDYFFNDNGTGDMKDRFLIFLETYERYWETTAFNEFRNYICSFMVIDLPTREQGLETGNTDPFLSFVRIQDVIDAEIENDATTHWLIYKIGSGEETEYIYQDDKRYVVLDNEKKIINDIPHGFGQTPARQFWTDNINANPFKKRHPEGYLLGKLDYIILHEVAKEYPELYAKFPIMWEYTQDVTNKDSSNIPMNNTPFNSSTTEFVGADPTGTQSTIMYTVRDQVQRSDKEKERIFAGSVYKKSVPKEGQADVGDPMGFINPDVETLKHIEESLDKRKVFVFKSATGKTPDIVNAQAKNEKDVMSQFEAQKDILTEVKTNFELAQKWATDFFGKILFKERYTGSVINLGTDFFLLTSEQIQEDLKSFKDIGMSDTLQLDKLNQFIETEHKTDIKAMTRVKLLLELDPFPTMSIPELLELKKEGAVDNESFQFRLQLPALIKRFEREVGVINSDLVLDGKDIEGIKDALMQMLILNTSNNDERDSEESQASGRTSN